MTCNVDQNAAITAVSAFKNGNSTPPLFQCKPKESSENSSGHWDLETESITIETYSNRYGRTDIQGCCWWGRGVLMTRGTCNFGRINHFLGINSAASKGYVNYYDVDFCIYPEVVCHGPYSRDLKWAVGYFEWIDKVQTFNRTRSYMDELDSLVENGLKETSAFIDIVGWALPVSCVEASAGCDLNIDLPLIDERRNNFLTLLDALALAELLPEITTTTTEATTTITSDVSLNSLPKESSQPTPRPDPPTNSPTDQPEYVPSTDVILLPSSSAYERDSTFVIRCLTMSTTIFYIIC